MAGTTLTGFDKEARNMVALMEEFGWTGRLSSKGHWIGRAPDGATCAVPRKLSAANRTSANCRADFRRWLRTQMPADVSEALADVDADGMDVVDEVILAGAVRKVTRARRKPARAPVLTIVSGGLNTDRDDQPPSADNVVIGREVISVESCTSPKRPDVPLTARRYSDGALEVACEYPGCGYVSPSVRGAAIHVGHQHKRDASPPPGVPVDVPAGDAVPDSVLSQVQALIAAPLHEQVEMLQAELARVRSERDAAQSRLDRLLGDLDALRAIMDGIG